MTHDTVDDVFKLMHLAIEQYKPYCKEHVRIRETYKNFNKMPTETLADFETCCEERDKFSATISHLAEVLKDAVRHEVKTEFNLRKGVA